jgi:hypothetical protein
VTVAVARSGRSLSVPFARAPLGSPPRQSCRPRPGRCRPTVARRCRRLASDCADRDKALTSRAIELHEIRRQRAAWDRDALTDLRGDDVEAWVDASRDHCRRVARPTATALRETLVDGWWDAARTAGCDAAMIAHRRSGIADLNALARMRMHRDGRLGADELVAGERAFATGDRIVARRNDRRTGVVNGTRAEVVAVDPSAGPCRSNPTR